MKNACRAFLWCLVLNLGGLTSVLFRYECSDKNVKIVK